MTTPLSSLSRARSVRSRKGRLALVVVLGLAVAPLAGCGSSEGGVEALVTSAPSAAPDETAAPTTAPSGATKADSQDGAAGGDQGAPAPEATAPPEGSDPTSASHAVDRGTLSPRAAMICEGQARASMQQVLGMGRDGAPETGFADGTFSCDYATADGPMKITVLQPNGASDTGEGSFEQMRSSAQSPQPIDGLQNFGLPAFTDPDGVVGFLKDRMVLRVDGTGLEGLSDEQKVDKAYQIASIAIACWVHHQ